MAKKSESVTADFDVDDANAAVLRIEEEVTEKGTPGPPYGTAWLRVWSTAGKPSLISTSGRVVQLVNSGVSITETETITFMGEDTSSLSRPNVDIHSFEAVGLFLDAKATPIPLPHFSVNPVLGKVRASQRCFGALAITYSTVYSRYSCEFARDPNATKGDPAKVPPVPRSESEFSPMVVVATKGLKVEAEELRPPPWEDDESSSRIGDLDKDEGAAKGGIVIEIAEAVALDGYTTEKGLGASCVVWVYFGAGETLMPIVSTGSIKDLTGVPTHRNNPQVVNEHVNWNNASSASTKYLPSSLGVTVNPSSSGFISAHEGAITPSFVTGVGEKVTTKIYMGNGAYRHGDERLLGMGEITLVDSLRLAIAATGTAFASYSTFRREYRIQWAPEGDWFPPVTISVLAGVRSGSLLISPPPDKGQK